MMNMDRQSMEDAFARQGITELSMSELAHLMKNMDVPGNAARAVLEKFGGEASTASISVPDFFTALFGEKDHESGMPNVTARKHMLFISDQVGLATHSAGISTRRDSVATRAGMMSDTSGAFGYNNFGVPLRLRADAKLARYWHCDGLLEYARLTLRHLSEGEPEGTVNGVACMAFSDQELAAAQAYFSDTGDRTLMKLPVAHFEIVSWQKLPPDVECIYTVVSIDAHVPPNWRYPILHSNLHKRVSQFAAYGADFAAEFVKTTRGWSMYWLDDKTEEVCDAIDDADVVSKDQSLDALIFESIGCPDAKDAIHGLADFVMFAEHPPEPVPGPTAPVIFSGPIEQSKTNYFCFGMGSLINTPSRVGTAGAVAQCAIPVVIDARYDFCPCWNFQNRAGGSQLTAGGMVMRKDPRNENPEAETAGVIYPGPSDEAKMAALDEREVGYTRCNIPNEYIRSLGWQLIPDGITVFQYVPNTELPDDHPARTKKSDGSLPPRAPFPTPEYPLPQTYVDVCILGCLEYSEEFAAKWIAGFVGWPSKKNDGHWLNDRPEARRPWTHQARHRAVDSVLARYIPDSFACRALPAEYALHLRTHFKPGDALNVTYSSYTAGAREPTLAGVRSPTHFIFEYDDRISKHRWEKVVSGSDMKMGIPCRLKKTAGFRRSFCLHVNNPGANFTAPALVADRDGRSVNGVFHAAPGRWLASGDGGPPPAGQDPFEGPGLQRVELNLSDFEVLVSFVSFLPGTKVYTYIAISPELPTYRHPIMQSLLDTILDGCLEYGEDFCAEWVDSTDGWGTDLKVFWLNDRQIARRPWMHLGGKYKIFDRLVHESTSDCVPSGVLLKRRLLEE